MKSKTKRFCIIDDDDVQIFITQKMLEASGASTKDSILVYNDGKEAFDDLKSRFEENRELPDVILLDVNMPIWNGWNFLDEFNKINRGKFIDVFMVSSSISYKEVLKSQTYPNVFGFFSKPLNVNIIQTKMIHL
ncbi:MAG: response regulator [Raineya sp.]|jgi:CheY-like chemotaxis protein|nr:response regulator [Raineya sp.]